MPANPHLYWQLLLQNIRLHFLQKLVVGLVLGTVFAIINYYDGCKLHVLYYNYFGCLLGTYIIWTLSMWVSGIINLHFDWLKSPYKKIMLLLASNMVIVSGGLLGVTVFLHMVKSQPLSMVHFYRNLFPSILVTIIVNLVYYGIDFFSFWKNSVLEVEQLKKENLRSQLESLKTQVSPHFLFNSLNTLMSVIDEDPQVAKNYVQKLSQVYRYLLQARDKDLSTLQEEIDFLKSYTYLLQIRYGDNLQININIPEDKLASHMPPLTLQMLLENAIKHNVISATRPLKVDIYIENGPKIVVVNNLQPKIIAVESNKVGLANIFERYKLADLDGIEVCKNGTTFKVLLPLMEKLEAR